jgi:quinol-cytochrome oxidoreductase complex cytochrome b subunit
VRSIPLGRESEEGVPYRRRCNMWVFWLFVVLLVTLGVFATYHDYKEDDWNL